MYLGNNQITYKGIETFLTHDVSKLKVIGLSKIIVI